VYILLREGATPSDCLKATFSAHVLLQLWESKAAASKAAAAAAAAAAAGKAGAGGSNATGTGASSSSSSSGGGGGGGSAPAAATSSSSKDKQKGGSAAAAGGAAAGGDPSTSTASSSSGAGGLLTPPTIPVKETIAKLKNLFKASADEQAAARLLLAESKSSMDQLFSEFSRQADKQGWKLPSTMLNPRETRILKVSPLAATL
jgi:hypothetical protein